MRKIYLFLMLSLLVLLSLSACRSKHDGGVEPIITTPTTSNNPTTPNNPNNPATPVQILSGVFVDAPVEGLTFVSGAQTGTTDASGGFKYEAGGTVEFKLGNVSLGKAPGKALITPVDLVKAIDSAATTTDPRVVQIAQFVMTVNANPVSAATMSMSSFAATNAASVTAVDLSAGAVDLVPLLGAIVPAKTLVPAADAAAHLQTTFAALTAPKAGAFAGFDSQANPTLGLRLVVTPNLVGNGFDVAGDAVSISGDTWDVAGTLTLNGALQATGTGNGTTPPPAMSIAGAVASATQLGASASFTLNNAPKQVSFTLEKAVAPAATGKFALAADLGVNTATQIQHVAAGMTILPDGQIIANLVEGEVTGLPLAPVLGGRSVRLSGIVTGAGNVIAMGGGPGEGETTVSRSSTPPATATLLAGTVNLDGTVSAKATNADITGGGAVIPPLSFVAATNTLADVYVGTHSDTAPNPAGSVVFGVNNDGSVHGYTRFMSPGKRFPESDDLIDGVVDAGGVFGIPPGYAIGNLGAIGIPPGAPGLVMTSDEGVNFGLFVGVFAGSINPASGAVAGNWITGPGVPATGTFNANLQ